jgi:hypothetical protein
MAYKKHTTWTEEIKLWNKQQFVENKMEIMQNILKIQWIPLLSKYITWISRSVLLCVCICKSLKVQGIKILSYRQFLDQYSTIHRIVQEQSLSEGNITPPSSYDVV